MADLQLADVTSAIASGAVKEDVLARTLEELKKYAYTYLYNLQNDMVRIYKTRTYYNKFTTQPDDVFSNNRYNSYKAFNIHLSFIYHNFRLKFRRSKYFDVPLTNDVVDQNKDIFVYNYLVFINGYLDTSAKIKCKEELTTICLKPEYMDAELATKFVDGAAIDILFLEDMDLIDVVMNKADLAKSNYGFTLNGITIPPRKKIFAFVYRTGGLKRCYEVTESNGVLSIPSDAGKYFNDTDDINIKLLMVQHFDEQFDVTPTDTFIQHKEHDMPVPANNSLVFSVNSESELTINCDQSYLTEKYPLDFKLPDNRQTNDRKD